MAEKIPFEVKEVIGVIDKNDNTGWATVVTYTSWNNRDAVYDIRDWNSETPDENSRMGKGITLTEDAAKELQKLLYKHFK